MMATPLPAATAPVARPDKLMRITSLAKAMLEEARTAPCDAAGCEQLKRVYQRTIASLDGVISAELHAELLHLAVRFDDASPSPSEIRVAQAELVGWLDGLVNGIVIAVRAEMAEAEARAQAIEEAEPATAELFVPGQYL